MLKFQWDGLRRGDTVFVHEARDADLGLRAGFVTLVDVRPSGHDVGIRLTTSTGTGTGPIVRPGRFAVLTSRPGMTTTAGVAATADPGDPTSAWLLAVKLSGVR